MGGVLVILVQGREFLGYVGRRAVRDAVFQVAASLGYTTLLSLVPLLAVALAVLTIFPAFEVAREAVQGFVLEHFVPAFGQAVQGYIARFISGTGQLTLIGVIGLGVTALMMLGTIENAFNVIFRVTRPRPLVTRVLLYWAFLTLGPLLAGVAVSLASWVSVVRGSGVEMGWGVEVVSRLAPWLLTVLAFTLLYVAVPNRRVVWIDALAGAVVAAVLFALLRSGLIVGLVSNVRVYQTIYGALAAVPIVLVWMYLSWVVILCGGVLVASLPEWRLRRDRVCEDTAPGRAVLALRCLGALHRVAGSGGGGLDRHRLLQLTGSPEESMARVLRCLSGARFVDRTVGGEWVLVRSLEQTPLLELFSVLDVGVVSLSGAPGLPGALAAILRDLAAAQADILSVPVASVLEDEAIRAG